MSQERNQQRGVLITVLAVLSILAGSTARADTEDRLAWFGDFRARIEQDWGSRDANAVARDDRLRLRARVRVGLRYSFSDRWEFGLRLRSGADASQQSAHVTLLDFDDNASGPAEFNLDRWYARANLANARGWAWVGRNALPFWKQNEMAWDDDVTVAGVGAGWRFIAGQTHSLEGRVGYSSLPVGMQAFSGTIASGQAIYRAETDAGTWIAALGMLALDADPGGSSGLFLQGNDARDYRIAVGSVQWALGHHPWVLGLDWIDNRKHYSAADPDPFTAAHARDTSAVVGFIRCGANKSRGDQSLQLSFARIEALAVNNSFAQDDWVRWGGGGQTRASDLRGWELRYVRSLGADSNLSARLYVAQALSSVEDGNRLRLDFNTRFPRK